jgi:hypothetical protein
LSGIDALKTRRKGLGICNRGPDQVRVLRLGELSKRNGLIDELYFSPLFFQKCPTYLVRCAVLERPQGFGNYEKLVPSSLILTLRSLGSVCRGNYFAHP